MLSRRHNRNSKSGASLVELLVSVVIIGIATAGMTELVWLGASWASSLNNRVDNFFAVRVFFNRLERDLHQCVGINEGTSQKLDMECLNRDTQDPTTGFPLSLSDANNKAKYDVKYEVVSATAPDTGYQIQVTRGGITTVALRGIVGPAKGTEVLPNVFQFVQSYPPFGDPLLGVADTAAPPISEVIVNLQMNRKDFSSQVSQDGSALNIRTEFFLRNRGFGK